MTRYMKVTDIR